MTKNLLNNYYKNNIKQKTNFVVVLFLNMPDLNYN